MNIEFDFNKLKGRIKEKNLNQAKIAEELNITESTFNLKLNNKSFFSQLEIYRIATLLDISKNEYEEYFFKLKV